MPKTVSISAFLLFCYLLSYIIQRTTLIKLWLSCSPLWHFCKFIWQHFTLPQAQLCGPAECTTHSVALIPSRAKPTTDKVEVCVRYFHGRVLESSDPLNNPEWFFSVLCSTSTSIPLSTNKWQTPENYLCSSVIISDRYFIFIVLMVSSLFSLTWGEEKNQKQM